MRRTIWIALTVLCAVVLLTAPVLAPPAISEARGQVVDQDGNPLAGVRLTFMPESGETPYSGKTNKKGRYFVPGMYNAQGENWQIEIEAEGYLPVSMTVESRTVNRVLVGEAYTAKISPGGAIPKVVIRPMGSATIDFSVAPTEQVMLPVQQEAQEQAAAAAAAAPSAPQRSPWDTALARVAQGDAAGAIPFFEEAIADEPADSERRSALAKVLYKLGRYEDAESQARQAVELDPGRLDNHLLLYGSFVAEGDLASAKTALLAAQERFPDEPRIARQLAFVATEFGDTQGAITAYEGLTRIQPEDAEAWLALAELYAETGALDRSEQAYQRVVELDPQGAHQAFFNLGALIMNKTDRSDGETRRAIGAFRKAIELKPDYVQAHKQLAFALLGVGDRAGAKGELEAYVRLAPDAPDSAQLQQLIKTLQ